MQRTWAWLQRWWALCWVTAVFVGIAGIVAWGFDAKARSDEIARQRLVAEAPHQDVARLTAELQARTNELAALREQHAAGVTAVQQAHAQQVAALRSEALACWERAISIARSLAEAP